MKKKENDINWANLLRNNNQNDFQDESIDIVAYNKDIDDALEAVARGEFTDHETVRKRFLKSVETNNMVK